MKMYKVMVLLVASVLLSGCAGLFVAGAATTVNLANPLFVFLYFVCLFIKCKGKRKSRYIRIGLLESVPNPYNVSTDSFFLNISA